MRHFIPLFQCFGGDVFEYPSCSSGLVFNEATGKCDYREAVPECKLPADDDQGGDMDS